MCFDASNLADTVHYGFILGIFMWLGASNLAEFRKFINLLVLYFINLLVLYFINLLVRLTWPRLFIMLLY